MIDVEGDGGARAQGDGLGRAGVEGAMRRFWIMGVDGMRQVIHEADGRGNEKFRCGRRLCDWWIDVSFQDTSDDSRAVEEAATHRCTAPWRGYEAYSIRPEKPKGRRL